MQLAWLVSEKGDELRADLMETYGVCLDAAPGSYDPSFVAALADQLPQSCRWRVSCDEDAWWDGDRLLMAFLINDLEALMYGLSDKKKRGKPPKLVGPSWLKRNKKRSLRAQAMDRKSLLRELSKPRRGER